MENAANDRTDPANQESEGEVSLRLAALSFGGVLLIISLGLFFAQISLHSLLFLAVLWVGFNAWLAGHSYEEIRGFMAAAINRALPALYIFLLIGMVIASFMHSGTIAALMYYGLEFLQPRFLLSFGLVLCALMSLFTGTSWGTVGTLGVVFMGIGAAMNIPLPIVAGMVVSGATFGDKMSPVSDTTNLAAMSAGTSLYSHIRSMLFTTLPTFSAVFLLFLAWGFLRPVGTIELREIAEIQTALQSEFRLFPLVTFIPFLVMLVLSVRRIPAELAMSASIVTACLIAVLYQGSDPVDVLNALWANSPSQTGIASLDDLLGRGGISSMSWTFLLAFLALMLGGILHGSGFLACLLRTLIARIRSAAAIVATTIAGGLLGNLAMGEAYISILLNCQLFQKKYQQAGLSPAVLSRSVEEGSTLTTGLIPWTTAGTFYAATLAVPVLDYLPYAVFNYLNGFVAILMAYFGLGLLRNSDSSLENSSA